MNTDNKLDDNNTTGGVQNTPSNTGVDLTATITDASATKEPQDDFVDIDQAPTAKEEDLKEMGINFVDKSDLNVLKEEMDKKAEAEEKAKELKEKAEEKFEEPKQKIPEMPKKPEEPKLVIEKVENKTPEPKQIEVKINQTEEGSDQAAEILDLEREFNQTVGTAGIASKSSSLNDDIFSLKSMLNKIKDKLGIKKTEVREELGNLKKVKDDIAKDIANIKELEESEDKIEGQIKKIESIKGDITNIEKEVEQELNS